jgi:PAS domain S-box-containing protein
LLVLIYPIDGLRSELNTVADADLEDSGLQRVNAENARYRLLVEAVTDYAIYMLDPEGTITSWNAGAHRFKGYEAAEILGQSFSKFYPPEAQQEGMPKRALEIAAREGKFEGEGWRVRKDGTCFWAHVVIDPIRDHDGQLIGFAKITRDLTERRKADLALRESQENFRLLVQGVSDYAIYMLDPNGRITNWNLGGKRLKGYEPDEIIGQHFSRFYSEDDRLRGEPEKGLQTAAKVGRFESEGWRIRKDGTRFWAHVVIDAIRDDSGRHIGFAKVTRDITERKAAAESLEVAREALFQAQKMEAVGRLTGGVAHDFNNLLMAVLSSLELLERRMPDDPKARRLLANAVEGAQRGASLTQRMLAFARRQELDPKLVEIPVLVRGMTDLLQRSLGPLVHIETRFPSSLPPVLVDDNQLELALLNLVVNARDAMPSGGTVTIAAREEVGGDALGLPPDTYLCLSVTDTGFGMDAETLARAREPFFTTKGVGKGTGLGLSMVHGLAEQSRGRLVIRSTPMAGTCVEVWLPIAGSCDAVAPKVRETRDPEERARPLTILAVDDDHLVLMNTVAMLDDLGHRVFHASSGREALEIFQRERAIDLVVSDVAMPHMSGAQLAEILRRDRPDLPIILATGYAEMPEDLDPGIPRLAKPFRQTDLSRIIRDVQPRLPKAEEIPPT